MYSLRERGWGALKEGAIRSRLALLSEKQLHEVCGRLENATKFTPWTAAEIERLVEIWMHKSWMKQHR